MLKDVKGHPRPDLHIELRRVCGARLNGADYQLERPGLTDPFAFFKGVVWGLAVTIIFMSVVLLLWLA